MKKITLSTLTILFSLASFAFRGPLGSFAFRGPVASFAFHGPVASFAFHGPSIRETLQQSFEKNYSSAENVHWNEDVFGYTVSFTIKTVLTRINYDRKGRFTGSLRNYSEQLLPFYLINLLIQKYPGQDIYGVTEISNATDINYFVKLQSSDSWTTVRIDNDGQTSVIERYNKGN